MGLLFFLGDGDWGDKEMRPNVELPSIYLVSICCHHTMKRAVVLSHRCHRRSRRDKKNMFWSVEEALTSVADEVLGAVGDVVDAAR